MFKKIIPQLTKTLLILMLVLSSLPGRSQSQGLTSGERAELTGTRKQVAMIVFAGLSGAIMGLSTLSFYGRPQDHLSNIAVGFAIGVIGGAIYTTYRTATRPYEAYDITQSDSMSRNIFDDETSKRFLARQTVEYYPGIGWRWEF